MADMSYDDFLKVPDWVADHPEILQRNLKLRAEHDPEQGIQVLQPVSVVLLRFRFVAVSSFPICPRNVYLGATGDLLLVTS